MRAGKNPHDRLLGHGPEALTDAELLSVFLGGKSSEEGAELARDLLASAGDLSRLMSWDRERLAQAGTGDSMAVALLASRELACRLLRPPKDRELLECPHSVACYLFARYSKLDQEVMGSLYLDVRHRLISETRAFQGTLWRAAVEPRQVLRRAFELGAAAIIVWHNHPSGDPSPSSEDLKFTRRLSKAGELMGVKLVDHLIIGEAQKWVSLACRGAF